MPPKKDEATDEAKANKKRKSEQVIEDKQQKTAKKAKTKQPVEDSEEEEPLTEEEIEDIDSKITEKYADPTLDITFKMLFGNEQSKDILISLLNSLLDFEGNKIITAVELNNKELPVSNVSDKKRESGIVSTIDILCTNKGKQKIAIEVQGQKTAYFLAREQEYMAKLIAGQVKHGEGKLYHKKVLDTYIIAICKDNVFTGNTELKDQSLFEIDVKPVIVQTSEVYPGNKMHWKFFELPKFQQNIIYKGMDKDSPLKYQWLEFLADCSERHDEPDRDAIIKKGYEIMKVAKWDHNTKVRYWKQKVNEQAAEEAMEEAEARGKAEGKLEARIEDKKKLLEGLKEAIEERMLHNKLVKFFPLFTEQQITALEDYIPTHQNASIDDLMSIIGGGGDVHMSEMD